MSTGDICARLGSGGASAGWTPEVPRADATAAVTVAGKSAVAVGSGRSSEPHPAMVTAVAATASSSPAILWLIVRPIIVSRVVLSNGK